MPGVPKCDTNIKISPFIKLFLESKFEVRFFLGANVYVLELPTITTRWLWYEKKVVWHQYQDISFSFY